MTAFLDWLRLHPWVATGFFAGALLGVVFCMPLLPYTIPDSAATLIGSAFGAGVSVWGAAWVLDGRERRDRAAAKVEVLKVLKPLAEESAIARDSVTVARDDLGQVLYFAANGPALWVAFDVTADRINHMKPLFECLGTPGIVVYADLGNCINSVKSGVRKLKDAMAERPPSLRVDDTLTEDAKAALNLLSSLFTSVGTAIRDA